MHNKLLSRKHPRQQGQTILLVAISLVSLLAMAAIAIDVVTLYVARSEIQRAADAAALAGAKAIADSGITTLLLSDPNFVTVQPWAQAAAFSQIGAVQQNNLVAGTAPSLSAETVDWSRQGNPHVTVSLRRDNLPTFFSKIWQKTAASVTATATAEAYNPANSTNVQGFTPIAPTGVKPWLVANTDPNNGGAPFVLSTGAIETGTAQPVIGEELVLTADCQPPGCTLLPGGNPPGVGPKNNPANYPQVEYVPALVSPNSGANVCPPCAGASDYEQSIACTDVTTSYQVLQCGGGTTQAQWDNGIYPGGRTGLSATGAECLIHASTTGLRKGQDEINNPGAKWPANALQITAQSGPQNGNLVTTSSSIVTIPIIDPGTFVATSPQVTVVGFLQAFITWVRGGNVNPNHTPGDINVTVLNIAGCSTTPNTATPVIGGSGGSGTSPVPVRLITPP